MLVSSRPQPSLHPTSAFSPHSWAAQLAPLDCTALDPTVALAPRGEEAQPASRFPWGDHPDLSPAQTWPALFAPLQTRTSAPRTTVAASKTASTPSAAMSASVAAASSYMTTNTTARKVSAASAAPGAPRTGLVGPHRLGMGTQGHRCHLHLAQCRLKVMGAPGGYLVLLPPRPQILPSSKYPNYPPLRVSLCMLGEEELVLVSRLLF